MTRDSFTIEDEQTSIERDAPDTYAEVSSDLADAAICRELAGREDDARALWAGARSYALLAHAANLAALGLR